MSRFAIAAFSLALVLGWAPGANATNFFAHLNGASEFPANASLGIGTAHVSFNPVTNQMEVQVDFSGLTGTTTASHIHCCTADPFNLLETAGVATTTPTFTGFPLGVTSGTYDHTFDMSLAASYNPAFIAANGGTVPSAEAVLIAGMLSGKSYLNIHTSFVKSGEIRGFLQVPEPESIALVLAGLLGMFAVGRKKKPQPVRIS